MVMVMVILGIAPSTQWILYLSIYKHIYLYGLFSNPYNKFKVFLCDSLTISIFLSILPLLLADFSFLSIIIPFLISSKKSGIYNLCPSAIWSLDHEIIEFEILNICIKRLIWKILYLVITQLICNTISQG